MADADDEVALLLLLQQLYHLIGTGGRVEVPDSCAVGGCHETFELWAEGEDADLDVAASDDGVGLHDAFENGAGEVVVGAEDGEVCLSEDACHVVDAEVELMVADGAGVDAHLVHQPNLYIAPEEVVVGRSLTEVAAIEVEQVGILLPFFLEHSDTTEESSAPSHEGIGKGFAEWHDATVRVVGVQDEQLLLLRCCREAYHQHGNQQYVLGILYHNIEAFLLFISKSSGKSEIMAIPLDC